MQFPITEIKIGSKDYPKLLAQIHDPPKQIYCRGNIGLLKSFCFGVVGTRKLTSYGKEATERIISDLAGNSITIVSGLAMGIDAIAHRAAIDNDLPTIAVLGSGIDDQTIYPKVNFQLAQKILKNNDLIISEYPRGFHANEKTFPQRNRIISGLSKGVLIVEADEKSGALITARCALDQNRDVFAVAGSIFSPMSRGPNQLIKKGAKLVTSAQDILEEYGQNLEFNFDSENNISTKNPTEKKILDILNEKEGLSADDIIKELELEISETLSALSTLEIKNKIKQKNGKYTTINAKS